MQRNYYNQKKLLHRTFTIIPLPAAVYNALEAVYNALDVTLTFNKGDKLLMLDPVPLDVNLQCEQQGEQEFVILVQAPDRILIDLIGHVLYDISNSFACDWALDGPGVENIESDSSPCPFQLYIKATS